MHDFQQGYLIYAVKQTSNCPEIDLKQWDNGYVAFSNREYPLQELKQLDLKQMLNQDQLPKDAEGYIMEIDLWRKTDHVYEEISIEREDTLFFIQHWQLFTQKIDGADLCFYRCASTAPRANSIFNQLKSIEVVVPDKRLHFFITKPD
ncbi:MAG: hypothetical protein Q9M37_02610 [Desulfonauticus sp.]|nr:hypothetical protein [Desulfonauticus sp.]